MAEPQNSDPMVDPYYLHGSDQLGLLLVCEKLTTTNYNDWSKTMNKLSLNAFAAKNKLGFVNDTIVAPAATNTQFSS
ncbi:unnamed protein product [Linum trigynum]|uniref:Retrotransposon Copia-like N-terminal domain-containing protein n=1 Tax=Linum trigynum TaxID=586398 RepID=A0AAV2E8Z3_9ROSI